MADLNHATIMGRMARDAEPKAMSHGYEEVRFTVATCFKDCCGTTKVGFFDCVAYDLKVATVAKEARKGDLVLVDGRLSQEAWRDRTPGAGRSTVKILADNVVLLDRKRSSAKKKRSKADTVDRWAPRPTMKCRPVVQVNELSPNGDNGSDVSQSE